MNTTDFFPSRPAARPTIYAFASTHPDHAGLLKVGYTETDPLARIRQQFPGGYKEFKVELIKPAMRPDGTSFTDHDIHAHLKARGHTNTTHEWFKCTADDVKAAIVAVMNRQANVENRTLSFRMRPEQEQAVTMFIRSFSTTSAMKPRCKMPFAPPMRCCASALMLAEL